MELDKEKEIETGAEELKPEVSPVEEIAVSAPDTVESTIEESIQEDSNEVLEKVAEVHPVSDSVDTVSVEAVAEPGAEIEATEVEETESDIDEDEVLVEEEDVVLDFSTMTQADLVNLLKTTIEEKPLNEIKSNVDQIKIAFYKKHRLQVEEKRKEFLASGGLLQDFVVEPDEIEVLFKEELKRYKELRSQYIQNLELEKEQNLKAKREVIESLKQLLDKKESLNQTFQEFRDLQRKWREIGHVPQSEVKDLWENYHLQLENFYSYVKINQELRDLDLKKNLEAKVEICEKAEELLLETSITKAFNELQKYHDQWREIGPVPEEKKEEIWERFKSATAQINTRHQEYYVNLKEEQKSNLEAKKQLCDKIDELNGTEPENHKDWNRMTSEILEIQKVWKTIGFAPKKYNAEIYERYKEACDVFFDKKKEFYGKVKDEQFENLQKKTELCIQAEALKESTEWKNTSQEMIRLQKQWKAIGPVPHRKSDQIWKRFREACDYFFTKKADFFANIDTIQDDNLKAKEALIEKIKAYNSGEDLAANLEALKDFQKQWMEIGHVPIDKKNDIQNLYREAINAKFDALKIDDSKKSMYKFKTRLETISQGSSQRDKFRGERDALLTKMKGLENDINVWENNIGFFANTKNADKLVKEVQKKIDKAKTDLNLLKEKLEMLDKLDN